MIYIGIDPGASGASVALCEDRSLVIARHNLTERDLANWFEIMSAQECFAMLERVGGIPGQGAPASFNFGASYGLLRGFLHAYRIPFETVPPGTWQKRLGYRRKKTWTDTQHRNKKKALAQEQFPQEKITHYNADAILLAEYCRRQRGGAGSVAE